MSARKKRQSLSQAAAKIQPRKIKTFIDKLNIVDRDELLDLRRDFMDGKLAAHITASDLYREVVVPRIGKVVAIDTFRHWMTGGNCGKR